MNGTTETFEHDAIERSRYGIQSIPTVAVDGEAVTGFVGAHPAAAIGQFLDDRIAEHTSSVQAA